MNEIKRMQQLAGINELGINPPIRSSLDQLERWEAEIQASDHKMTQIKLALKCTEGVIWIWREKYPNDNRPQAALNAVKAYINNPSEENRQNCREAADAAWDAVDAADDAADDVAATAANAAYVTALAIAYTAYTANNAAAAAYHAIQALTMYQEKHQLNEL